MMTLSQILPDVPARTRQRWAAILSAAGVIAPATSNLGTGNTYDQGAAERLEEFARLVRVEGQTVEAATAAMTATTPRHAGQEDRATVAAEAATSATAGEAERRAAELAREAETLRQELAQERAAREAEAARARGEELARLDAERRALEAARATDEAKREARDATNAATIANQSAGAAVAKLTAARRRVERLTVWGRLRAAFAFVIRKEVDGALLLLPERAESRKDDQAKAA